MIGAAPKLRFGSFEFDFAAQVLNRNGQRVRLSASQTRLLTFFLARPGVLITRDQIASQLWDDTSNIDVSNGINTAVNRLRYALQDDTTEPVYIETVIGLGYRFIAPAEPVVVRSAEGPALTGPEAKQEAGADAPWPSGAQPWPQSSAAPILSRKSATAGELSRNEAPRRHRRIAVGLAATIAVAILTAATAFVWRHESRAPASPSPAPLLPDNFVRVTFNDADNKVTGAAVSPTGESIAWADQSGVSVSWLDPPSTRLLASPPEFQARRIDWYPDGQRLALSGTSIHSERQQVWELYLNGTAPKLVADDADLATVAPDGASIAMTRHQDMEIDIAPADGGLPRTLVHAGDKESFAFLLWSRSGRYLMDERSSQRRPAQSDPAVTHLSVLEAQKQWNYEAIDAGSGKLLARQENLRFDSGYILDDGRLFYPEAVAPTSADGAGFNGATSFNMLRTDPRDGRILDPPRTLVTTPGGEPRSFTASANGSQVAIIMSRSTADTFIGRLRYPGPFLDGAAQLSHRSIESYPHAWTPRDDAVLIENNNLGKAAVFELRLDQSSPRLVAQLPDDAVMAEFTPDGRWILFLGIAARPPRVRSVFRIPAEGGVPEQLPTSGEVEEFHCSAGKAGRCVLREAVAGKELVYYAIDPIGGMGPELARTPWQPSLLGDWSLSPDGTTAVIANHDSRDPRLGLLRLLGPDAKVDDIHVQGFGALLGANWSTDGRGFFVESRTVSGYLLLFVDLSGHVKLLRESRTPIWGAPSHDGTKLAFPWVTFRNNVLTEKVIGN